MTEKQIIDGSKLIAEFMGAEILKKGQKAYDMDDKFPNGMDRQFPEVMKYHSSWDWLMPVVTKVFDWFEANWTNKSKGCIISEEVQQSLISTEIEVVFCKCVEFIKFYNNERD